MIHEFTCEIIYHQQNEIREEAMAKSKQEPQTDDIAINIDDIPLPTSSEETGIEDAFSMPPAFNFSFVGIGQGGSRLAESFYQLGYRRVCAVNTTEKDLVHIKIPEANKLTIRGERTEKDGAGKDPAVAEAAINSQAEEVYDLLKRCWGEKYDWAFLCIGAGGGTGAGAFAKTHEIIVRLMADLKLGKRVGIVCALPKNDEGQRVAKNAVATLQKISSLGLSPVIVIDNERIKAIYPKVPVSKFWDVANKGICTLLHLFNQIAAQSSPFTTFDPADFATLLSSGVVAFGATALERYGSQADISKAIRQQLQSNILASVDLNRGKRAGCIFIGSREILDEIPQQNLDHGFEMLSRIMAEGSVVHRGIYVGSKNDLRVYTMIGELPFPAQRLQELSKIAGKLNEYAGG